MVKDDRLIGRPQAAFDPSLALLNPMQEFDSYSNFLPAPHLETFLSEVDNVDPSLIDDDFVSQLFAVSEEDIVPSDEQILYAKMCAYGFIKNPSGFGKTLEPAIDVNGNALLKVSVRINDIRKLNSATALGMLAFGIPKDVAEAISSTQVTPTAVIIRLAQTGVVNIQSLYFHQSNKDQISSLRSKLGQPVGISLHQLTLDKDSELSEFASNEITLTLLSMTPDTELVLDALRADVTFRDIMRSLRETGADAESVLRSAINGIDNNMLNFIAGVL